jgi:DNA polymerase-4
VDPGQNTKSISAETTFDTDLADPLVLEIHLWRMAEKLGRRLREKGFAAGGVVLKLKTARFASRTRAQRLPGPTALPDLLFQAGRGLLRREADGTAFRLIGLGAAPLLPGRLADQPDLGDPEAPRRVAMQRAVDALRGRYGDGVIGRGRGHVR